MLYFIIGVLALLVALGLTVILIDAVPLVLRWLDRIHTGAFNDEASWENAVKKVDNRWLKKTPSVKVTDNTRLTVIDRLKGKYKSAKIQSWQKAALLLGADEGDAQGFIKRELESFKNGLAKYETPDSALLAWALLRRTEDKMNLKPLCDAVFVMLCENAGKDGTVVYNKTVPDMRFVDTVGMVCPFLFEYAAVYKKTEASALAKKQLDEYLKYGMHERYFVPVHCFNIKNSSPSGIYGWGRGCGWLAMGFCGAIISGEDDDYLDDAEKYAETLLSFQRANGSWSRQIFSEITGESSATAMIACFMELLYKKTGKQRYHEAAGSAAEYLRSVTRVSGKVDMAQGDTKGIGFYSTLLDRLPAAQGFTSWLNILKKT